MAYATIFLTSGYLFYKKEDGYFLHGYANYILKNVKSILRPYLIFALISILLKEVMSRGYGETSRWMYYLKAIILGGGDLEKINLPLWFLELFFITKICYYLLRYLKRKSRVLYGILCLIIFVGTIPYQSMVTGRPAFHINVLPAGLGFMIMGSFLQKWKKDVKCYIIQRMGAVRRKYILGF